NLVEIENELTDLLSLSVNNVKDFVPEDEQQDTIEEKLEDEIRADWMMLAEMDPNTIVVGSSNFGLNYTDRNFDWNGDIRQQYSNLNFDDVDTFIYQVLGRDTINNEDLNIPSVEYSNLNNKQIRVLSRIVLHYNKIVTNITIELIRIIVMGTAGTGKLYLINSIQQKLQKIAKNISVEYSPVIVLVSTE
ncbi:28500_t:CDS:1, partial [Racocetra persica]